MERIRLIQYRDTQMCYYRAELAGTINVIVFFVIFPGGLVSSTAKFEGQAQRDYFFNNFEKGAQVETVYKLLEKEYKAKVFENELKIKDGELSFLAAQANKNKS